jgi:hypothetical protein
VQPPPRPEESPAEKVQALRAEALRKQLLQCSLDRAPVLDHNALRKEYLAARTPALRELDRRCAPVMRKATLPAIWLVVKVWFFALVVIAVVVRTGLAPWGQAVEDWLTEKTGVRLIGGNVLWLLLTAGLLCGAVKAWDIAVTVRATWAELGPFPADTPLWRIVQVREYFPRK